MIPAFDSDGNLPPGVHECNWHEFTEVFGWNARRQWLLAGLERALRSLRFAGCPKAFIDGSFVTTKEAPSDYDGCWEAAGVDPLLLDPVLLRFDNGRLAQKIKFRGELFLANDIADGLAGKRYMEFFQQNKNGTTKGIVSLQLGSLP